MQKQDWHKAVLALVVWREARGESLEGKFAVANVIRNRVLATKLPDQWEDVIEKKWQFSSLTAPGDAMLVQWPRDEDPTWVESMNVAEQVYSGSAPDNTGGAVFYANLAAVPQESSFWKIIADTVKHPMTTKIGHHTFYK